VKHQEDFHESKVKIEFFKNGETLKNEDIGEIPTFPAI